MTIYDLLHKDHEEISKLLNKLETSSEGAIKTRENTFSKLKNELTAHSEAEQQTFYTALKNNEKTHELILEGIQEHELVSHLLEELDSMNKGTEDWKAKLSVLRENVEHHVDEEENELFEHARQVLSDDQAQRIARQFEEQKQQSMANA
ncbi:MAG: hemerythrin domain-containing protein [Gammaproteobacteria bacterium]